MTNYDCWKEICAEFCKKKSLELIFINSDNFGCMKPDGTMLHIYADELEQYLGG